MQAPDKISSNIDANVIQNPETNDLTESKFYISIDKFSKIATVQILSQSKKAYYFNID